MQNYGYNFEYFKVAIASTQGWAKKMEDKNTCILNINNNHNCAYFGVFDGHQGSQVSEFASQNLHKIFLGQTLLCADPVTRIFLYQNHIKI